MCAAPARKSFALIAFSVLCGCVIWAAAITLPAPQVSAAEPSHTGDLDKYAPTPEQLREAFQRTQRLGQATARVYKSQISPHPFQNNTHFWYRNDLRGGAKEFIVVEAERGTRAAAFDHAKLAAPLSKAASTPYHADRLPFD